MTVGDLPAVNASLNGLSGVLLFSGWLFIRSGKVLQHRACMVSAFLCSIIFLACYLAYHFLAGVVYYHGAWGNIYYPILISHTLLAVLVPALAMRTLFLAVKERFEEHKRAARWTFPIWMYVSVTGVIVYEMLYRL